MQLGRYLLPGALARVPHLRGLPPNRPITLLEAEHCSERSFESMATFLEEIFY
jgi:hypothetical protein